MNMFIDCSLVVVFGTFIFHPCYIIYIGNAGWSLIIWVFPCQIYGPESSGKTTLALHAIAEVQV